MKIAQDKTIVPILLKIPNILWGDLEDRKVYGLRIATFITDDNGIVSFFNYNPSYSYILMDEEGNVFPEYIKKFEWHERGTGESIPREKVKQLEEKLKEYESNRN